MFSKRLGILIALLMLALLPALTAAVADDASGQIGVEQLVRGEPYAPVVVEKTGVIQGTEKMVPPAAGLEAVLPGDAKEATLGPVAPAVYPHGTILKEGFEGVWPWGMWRSFDNNGSNYGSYCWDDDDYLPWDGWWSAWVANGCANGLDPQYWYYPNNMDSWMTWGPFDTGTKGAGFQFRYWARTEPNYDKFYWCASPNNVTYYCNVFSGNSNGWKLGKINLKKVPGYGNMVGDPTVWIGFVFRSDNSVVSDGVFVDAVKVKVK